MDYYLYSILIKKKDIKEGFSVRSIFGIQETIAPLIVSILASYLCYLRNIDKPKIYKIFVCTIAFLFSGIYILYYFISNFAYSQKVQVNNDLSLLQ